MVNERNRTVPIYKVVAAAMVDIYGDISQAGLQQTLMFNAARGFRKLNNEILKNSRRKVLLHVNKNTHTATLPLDFYEESFVGVIDDNGQKVPLRMRTDLTDTNNIDDIPCEDKCPKCAQDKNICNELTITEDTILVIINNSTYEQTIIKKLYPNGDYFIETRIPLLDINTNTVVYTTQKEFVAKLSLKDCGCIEDTPENIAVIKCNACDVYCNYFASCCSTPLDASYQIFPETGLIKVANNFNFDKIYLEYQGFLPKKNGQYQVPEICFETLVNWIKFKVVENKQNVPLGVRQWHWERYRVERGNMEKLVGRMGIQQIIQSIGLIPKFDVNWYPDNYCFTPPQSTAMAPTDSCSAQQATCPPTSSKSFTPFDILVVAGNGAGTPTVGVATYQNNKLINYLGINVIFINNTTLTKLQNDNQTAKDFSIDPITGILTVYQGDGVTLRLWQDGDILAIPTFFKLV